MLDAVLVRGRTAECASNCPAAAEVAGAEEKSTMIRAWRGVTRVLSGLLALPDGFPAEGMYRPDRCERLEVWGQEEPKLVRVPYWLQR